ncbi:MAG: glycosyltransferase, partial [Thermodesulfobacteriota bacterium]|nr:glycosyltransferase [Thermodesulfobacteriota bacterium]
QVCEDFIPVFEAAAGSGEKSFVFANVSNTPYVHPFALTSEKILCFRLYCDRNNFFCLKFRTATYIRINTCEICVDIFQEDPDRDDVRAEAPGFEPGPIRSCRFNALEAMDNQYYSVLFPSVTDSGGKQFRIAIYSPDASYDNHIALWCRKLDEPPFTPTDHEDPLLCPPVPCQDPIITSLIWDVPLPGMVTAARGKADHIFFMHHDPKPGMSWTHAAAVLMRLNRSAMAASRSIAVEIWGIPDPEVQAYCHQNHIVYHVLEKEDHHENQVLPRFLEQAGKADAEKLIWFSSTDFVPQKDFLENAEAFFREQPDTGLLFFLVKDCSNRVLHAFGQTTCEGCVDLFPWDMPADHPSLGCVRQIDGAGFPWFAMRSDLPCAGDPEDMMDMVLNAYETEVYQVTEWIWRLKVQGISTVFDAGVSFFGETAGFGETPGLPAFEDALHRDRQVFLTRWDPCLISLPNVSSTRSALLNPGKKQRALVVDLTLPTFDEDSGSLRMFELLGLLVQMGLQVTFVPDNRDNSPKYRRPLELMGIEVFTGEYTLSHALEGLEYDMIILSRVNIAHRYMNQVRLINPGARIYYDTVDIHYVRELRQAEIEHNDQLRKNALNTKKMELAACIMADVVFTVTTADKHHLHKELPFLSCFVLPNIYKEMPIPMSWENTEGLVFIGNYNHQPNEDAVYYFVEKVFPLVQKHIPEIKLYLIGSNMKNEMKALASDTIKVLGWVEKVEPELAKRRVMVSSLRYGAGMKGKIGQAMSLGLPVVSTRIGAEGMGLEDEKTVLVADEPEFFAEKVCRLYTDKALWENISLNAKNFIFSRYGRESVKQKLEDFIAKDVKSPLYTRLSSFYGRAD